ncbi:hypothetical protein Tco_1311956 [Tanacetum coccineum]
MAFPSHISQCNWTSLNYGVDIVIYPLFRTNLQQLENMSSQIPFEFRQGGISGDNRDEFIVVFGVDVFLILDFPLPFGANCYWYLTFWIKIFVEWISDPKFYKVIGVGPFEEARDQWQLQLSQYLLILSDEKASTITPVNSIVAQWVETTLVASNHPLIMWLSSLSRIPILIRPDGEKMHHQSTLPPLPSIHHSYATNPSEGS